jgi:excisionase family DNA binding protein
MPQRFSLGRTASGLAFLKIPEYFTSGLAPESDSMSDDIMTVREVAEFLKVTERTIYRLAAESQIPSFKVGGSWRFRRADLVKWMSKQADRVADTRKGR